MYSFGIDLGGTNIAVGVVDTETGAIVKKGSVPTLASRHADEIMKDMAGLCKSLAEEMGLDEFNAELKKKSDYYTKNFYFN